MHKKVLVRSVSEHRIAHKLGEFCVVLALVLTACASAPESTVVVTPDFFTAVPQVYLGAFMVTADLEAQIGYDFPVRLFYLGWGKFFNNGPFTIDAAQGRISLATWEFRPQLSGPEDPYALQPLQAVIDGKHDDYLRRFAMDAKAFGQPLFLRWGHEMNGDWYPWSGSANGASELAGYGDHMQPDGPERFVSAYRHIHDVFLQESATNVIWVWCPNVVMEGNLGADWNAIANYYPGDEYVDWLCMDGYNWGTSQDWTSWQSFDQVFRETYAQLQTINASKPMMIGETASSELGGDKPGWISDAVSRLRTDYPQVRLLIWFNLNKETDWRIDSTNASLGAFRKALSKYEWGQIPWPGIRSQTK